MNAADLVDSDVLTLCWMCHRVVQLTCEQAVVAEAERIALDVVSVAFCPRCAPGRHPYDGQAPNL